MMRMSFVLVALVAAVCMGDVSCTPAVTYDDGSMWIFDLSALNHDVGGVDMVATDSDSNQFFFNICGVTTAGANESCANSSVCELPANGNYTNAGLLSTQKVSPLNGSQPGQGLSLSYQVGEIRTTINLLCRPGDDEPFIGQAQHDGENHFIITVGTKHACGEIHPAKSVCRPFLTFDDGSIWQYDLSEFHHGKLFDDLMVFAPGMLTVMLNPCGQTTEAASGKCFDSSVCMETDSHGYVSGGLQDTQKFAFFNDTDPSMGVVVSYSGGDDVGCNGVKRSFSINFKCNPNATEPVAEWVEEVSTCQYRVNIETDHGCGYPFSDNSSSSSSGEGPFESTPVITYSDGSMWQYDLSGLWHEKGRSDTAAVDDDDFTFFYINFCGETTADSSDGKCEGASVCSVGVDGVVHNQGLLISQTFSAADIEPGQGFVITYSGGDNCSSSLKRSTNITLMCDPDSYSPHMEFCKSSYDCTELIGFKTKFACGEPYVPSSSSSNSSSSGHHPSSSGGIIIVPSMLFVAVSMLVILFIY